MFDLLATALSWFYALVPSFGVAIILLTVAILVVVTPLTLKGTRSMLELQIHQPELKRIQNQYRDDRQKMNEELMKFYSEHKINPVGGCLPLLIQAPVFIILYNVIRGLTQRTDLLGSFLEGGDASRSGFFNPKYLDQSSELYRALHSTNEMISWGVDLSRSAVQAMGDGLGTGLPYVLLILGATATSYYQQKQIQGRSTAQINPQMQMITRIMPLFITFISLTLPAALVLYFLASGLYRIGQQAIITRHVYGPHRERLEEAQAKGAITTTGKESDAPAPGGFLGRLLSPGAAAAPAANGRNGKNDSGPAGNGKATSGKSAGAGAGDRAKVGAGAGPGPGKPSGRVTPPGSRSAASRKKKKRK
ncbi:MAG: YidC/Oxa1 family membrane protein insertase [Acidimicrobiia bacterium]|nr:YidC/Oxa1 family membrane protein insertase [Acidimicrobiia bacterium]